MTRFVFFLILAVIIILAGWGLYRFFCGAEGCFGRSSVESAATPTENSLAEGVGSFDPVSEMFLVEETEPIAIVGTREESADDFAADVATSELVQEEVGMAEEDEMEGGVRTSPQTGPSGIFAIVLSIIIALIGTRIITQRTRKTFVS